MAETNKIPALCNIWSHFELGDLTKLVSVLVVLAYVIGVIAINTYLHGLGIVDFSFAKPKLLLTGILVFTSFLLLAFPAIFSAWLVASGTHQGRGIFSLKRTLVLVLGFLFVLLVAAVPLCFAGRPAIGQVTVWQVWKLMKPHHGGWMKFLTALLIALEVYLPIFFAALSVYAATRLFAPEGSEQLIQRISHRWVGLAFATVGFVVSVVGYICVFTLTFYSLIPQEFGGGKPYYQSFAIANEDPCQLQQLGIPFTHRNITRLVPVLHETDTLVAVWLPFSEGNKPEDGDFAVAELDKTQITATRVGDQSDVKSSPLLPQTCTN